VKLPSEPTAAPLFRFAVAAIRTRAVRSTVPAGGSGWGSAASAMRSKKRITIVGLLVLLVVCGCRPKTFRQSSGSMEPTIKKGEVIVADMAAYSGATPARWDVIVFTEPKSGQPWCSRVVGLPGESIDIRRQGIFINGTNAPLPAHLTNLTHLAAIPNGPPPTVSFPFSIPPGSYFVLGDNTTNAYDSRFWGALPAQSITGRVTGK